MSNLRRAPGRNRRIVAALCAGALLAIPAAQATTQDPGAERVTLSEALDLLEKQNPDALAARLQVAQADAEHLTARRYANPSVRVDVDTLPVGQTNPPGLSVGQTVGGTVRLDQPLVLWGKRRLRLQGAEAGVAAAREQERDILRQLRSAVRDAFYGVLHDRQLVDFTTANRERYQQIVDLNARRFRSGDISEVDFRKVELENLKHVAEEEAARRALAERRQLLGRLIGRAAGVDAIGRLTAPAVQTDGDQALRLALDNRPDLAAAQRAREQAELALDLARRERYPDVTVGVDYTHSEFVTAGNIRNTVGVGFSLPLPLLNRNQGEIAKAEVALRQAETDLERVRLDIAQDVHDAIEHYQSARRLLATYESGYLEHAKVTVDAAEKSYRIGAASLLELLDAERTYAATQTDYLDTVFDARASFDALERSVGVALSEE
jgi:cobalt-zinc-cadmium efflux system outer membrane protein